MSIALLATLGSVILDTVSNIITEKDASNRSVFIWTGFGILILAWIAYTNQKKG